MKYVGAHVSTSGGVQNAPLNAHKLGAKAFGMFTKNQRQWQAKPLTEENVRSFKDNCVRLGYAPQYILPHDSYLINLCHPDEAGLTKSRNAFVDEFKRCEQLGLKYLNFHPGSHLGNLSETQALARIAASIDIALEQTCGVTAIIENTSGQGHHLGYRFEHLATIIQQVHDRSRVGVCLDTCHAFTAGYDLKIPAGYDATMAEFQRIVGFEYLKAIHLNDCKKTQGSRVDRHANIGLGTLGEGTFDLLMNDSRLDNIPMILETPDDTLWHAEIKMLYDMQRSQSNTEKDHI